MSPETRNNTQSLFFQALCILTSSDEEKRDACLLLSEDTRTHPLNPFELDSRISAAEESCCSPELV